MRYGEVSQVSGPACGVLAGKRRNEGAVQVLTPGLEACAAWAGAAPPAPGGSSAPQRAGAKATCRGCGGPWGLRRPTGS